MLLRPRISVFLGADPRCSFVRRDYKSTQIREKIDYPLSFGNCVIAHGFRGKGRVSTRHGWKKVYGTVKESWRKRNDCPILERASVNYIQDTLKKGITLSTLWDTGTLMAKLGIYSLKIRTEMQKNWRVHRLHFEKRHITENTDITRTFQINHGKIHQ